MRRPDIRLSGILFNMKFYLLFNRKPKKKHPIQEWYIIKKKRKKKRQPMQIE